MTVKVYKGNYYDKVEGKNQASAWCNAQQTDRHVAQPSNIIRCIT